MSTQRSKAEITEYLAEKLAEKELTPAAIETLANWVISEKYTIFQIEVFPTGIRIDLEAQHALSEMNIERLTEESKLTPNMIRSVEASESLRDLNLTNIRLVADMPSRR